MDTLMRARKALLDHPAAPKIELVADEPYNGRPSNAVYVLPLQASTQLTLTTIASPQCELLQATTAEINRAVNSLALLAQSALEQSNRISEQFERQAEFSLAHKNELALAAEGLTKVLAAEAIVTELLAVLLLETEPVLIELYNQELTLAQRNVDTARNDPEYALAFSIKAQADALMDAALEQHARWEFEFSSKLSSASAALEAAQTLYEDLSRTELAAAETRMPVWDPGVLDLLNTNQGIRDGIRFMPATLEELSWTIQDAELPRAAPIEIATFGAALEQLLGRTRTEPLPGLAERATLPGARPLREEDTAISTTLFARGVLGRTLAKDTQQLTTVAPLIRASVPLGSYCGSLHRVDTEHAVVSGSTTSSTLLVTELEFSPKKRSRMETYLGTLDYKVRVRGLPAGITCRLDLLRYARISAGKSMGIDWLWRDMDNWDYAVLERLRRLGLTCTSSSITELRSLGMAAVLREAVSWAASDMMGLVKVISGPTRPTQVKLADLRIDSGETKSASQLNLCAQVDCRAPALLPSVVSKSVLGARITGQLGWADHFWKSVRMRSRIDFEMPQELSEPREREKVSPIGGVP